MLSLDTSGCILVEGRKNKLRAWGDSASNRPSSQFTRGYHPALKIAFRSERIEPHKDLERSHCLSTSRKATGTAVLGSRATSTFRE